VEFGAKNLILGENKRLYRVQVWDTAGQETFRSITRSYYKNSACSFLVYDITNRETFKNLNTWLEECKSQTPKTIFMVLVGNKIDLSDKRQVSTEEGKEFAAKNNMLFIETSAKTNYNIDEIFTMSANEIAKKIDMGYYDLSNDNCGIKQNLNSTDNISNRPSNRPKLLSQYSNTNGDKKKGMLLNLLTFKGIVLKL